MKMLLLRVIVTLVACWIVKCDLLDLYVQHMDETMRTTFYRNKRHPMDPVSRRIKRSLEEDKLLISNFKKQRFNENWLKQWKAKNKIVPYKNDVLDFPNKLEQTLNSDQHEIFSTQNSQYSEKTLTVHEYAAENSQLNMSQDSITEELEKTSEIELITVENQTNEKLIETLEFEEGLPEKMESEDNSQFEIISENEQINPKPFVGPNYKRNPSWDSQIPKKYFPEKLAKNARKAKSYIKDETAMRSRRSTNDIFNNKTWNFTRYEKLDEDLILEWDFSNEEKIIFRITGRTRGYIGIGFNDKISMNGADIFLVWVEESTNLPYVLDLHGDNSKATPIIDISQDVEVIDGMHNNSYTIVTFARKWQTCDPQDRELSGDTIRVLWALHKDDPILNNSPLWHGEKKGGKILRLKTAVVDSPLRETNDIRHWDVKLTQFEVTNTVDTIYWCKIFTPSLNKKHHMIGYTPLIEKANEDLVHHMILYECTSLLLGEYTRIAGTRCYIPTMPKTWNSCLQPIVIWARGSKGEWMPEHVGMPIAEQGENSYYMLEIHYNNPTMKKVNDSSGIRLYLTEKLRPQEAGILVTGVAVSPFHLIPQQRKEYTTVGYCTSNCTDMMFPKHGINIVSVVLHSHLAGRRLSLKHIRRDKELPSIVQDNHFDFDYQQSYTLEKEVKVLPGDELIAECVYNTLNRTKPTFGGYAITQEMCLAFIVHYPRTRLAGCYSMTPIKFFLDVLAIKGFRGMTIDHFEKLFLTNASDLTSSSKQLPGYPNIKSTEGVDETTIKETKSALRTMRDHIDEREDEDFFTRVIIEDPPEFRDRTLFEHLMAMQWKDDLLAEAVEYRFYHGEHMAFCRKRDDKLVLPTFIQNLTNYTALPEMTCKFKSDSSRVSYIYLINLVTMIIALIIIL